MSSKLLSFSILAYLGVCFAIPLETIAQRHWIDSIMITPGAGLYKTLRVDDKGNAFWGQGLKDATEGANGITLNDTFNRLDLEGGLNRETEIRITNAAHKLQFQGSGVDMFSLDVSTFSVDGLNDRVGIGTNTPLQRLDVNGNIVFKNMLLPNNDPGNYGQVLTSQGNISAPNWTDPYIPVFGDIKYSYLTSDHEGWIKLDGRAKSLLTATQQVQANVIGIGNNIPNATDVIFSQNGQPLGTFKGSDELLIQNNNLPTNAFSINATSNLTGNHNHYIPSTNRNTSINGNHNHTYWDDGCCGYVGWVLIQAGGPARTGAQKRNTGFAGNHNHLVDIGNLWSDVRGEHNHSISGTLRLNSGPQQPLNIKPMTLNFNVYMYLGD
ncbi:MAG: hypothetical protein MUE53_02930 [Chitinophagales bacterium]|nr:hypothetical protein [Chitinophagales bacterium]